MNNNLAPRKNVLANGVVLVYRNAERRTLRDNDLLDEFGEVTDYLSDYNENLMHLSTRNKDVMELWWDGRLVALRERGKELRKQSLEYKIDKLIKEVYKLKIKIDENKKGE